MNEVPKGSGYRIGIAFNLKKNNEDEMEDEQAEYDNISTIEAIEAALKKTGCETVYLEAGRDFSKNLSDSGVDIVFNVAEGKGGRGREAHIPALLSFLNIPFTGSDETTLCIALDKTLTKRILTTFGVKTPKYQLIEHPSEFKKKLNFPLIIKPNAEGSSKGISDFAIVYNTDELKYLIGKNYGMYRQPILIEEYIRGREFTVGIIGNGNDTIIFTPMEIKYKKNEEKYNIYSYSVKKNYKEYVEYICPPQVENKIEKKMIKVAKKIYESLSCRDFSRIDFRASMDGEVFFLEINPLPGLAPNYSDFPMIGEFNGINYDQLIKMILNSALKRYGMEPVK